MAIGSGVATFKVDAGSKYVDTMGVDLSSVILSGDKVKVASEIVEVATVNSDSLILSTYHVAGSDGIAVEAYRMDTYVCIGYIANNDNDFVEVNGNSLESLVASGNTLQIISGSSSVSLLEVTSVSGSVAHLASIYNGVTVTGSVYLRKKFIVPAAASSTLMKHAI